MKKLKSQWLIACSVVVVVVAGLLVYGFAPRSVPPGQSAMLLLSSGNLDRMKEAFNAHPERTRIIAFLSPTCGACVHGAAALQSVLAEVDGAIDVLAVWEPVLASDLTPPVDQTLALITDKRVWQVYDRTHLMSDLMRKGMLAHPSSIPVNRQRTQESEEGILWDAVAVFAPGSAWKDSLPAPVYLNGDVQDVTAELKTFLRSTVIASAPLGKR